MVWAKTMIALSLCIFSCMSMKGEDLLPNMPSDKEVLLQKVGAKLPELAHYPFLKFPNDDYKTLFDFYPDDKVLLFGYGSLINKASAARNMKPEALESMEPALSFGSKRIFNYGVKKTDHWGAGQNRKEKAMLNLTPTLNIRSAVNGVTFYVDKKDLQSLIQREKGYDLIPIPVVSWDEVMDQTKDPEIKIAYAFVASNEPRDHIVYTSTEYYPVRGYLHAIQEGAREYGADFEEFWNKSTFLADGTTSIEEWDEKTFEGILCSTESWT